MEKTTVTLHSRFQIGQVDPRIFGGFLEHIGRAVYEGVYDPKCASADEDGFRGDVMEALRRLDMTAMRYPGGNFVSGYHWMDGVGPRDQRPVMRDLAWQSLDPNTFGTDEFIKLSHKMGWTPMFTVNLGTGTPEEARNWVEYTNCPAGSKYSNLRAANASIEPYGIPLWCLGNEMDGPWQLGHVPAEQYAINAQQAAKMMKDVDRKIETIVCGTCSVDLPTYMEWDRKVLEYIGPYADYISLHRYVGNRAGDTPDFLAVTNAIDRQIEEMDAVCRFVQARHKSRKRTYLCFDEWNVWYKATYLDGEGQFAPPLNQETYNLEDALVVAGFLHSFIRHADSVKIANLAQIVNVIAPIMTRGDELLIQAPFYPFEMFSKRRNGVSLRTHVDGPAYAGKTQGTVNYIDTSAILDRDRLHVFLTNRSLTDAAPVRIQLADRPLTALDSGEVMCGDDPKAVNTYEDQTVIAYGPLGGVTVRDGVAEFELPPLSVAAATFRLG
jgi:alpha-L-arabinofuranosidase